MKEKNNKTSNSKITIVPTKINNESSILVLSKMTTPLYINSQNFQVLLRCLFRRMIINSETDQMVVYKSKGKMTTILVKRIIEKDSLNTFYICTETEVFDFLSKIV